MIPKPISDTGRVRTRFSRNFSRTVGTLSEIKIQVKIDIIDEEERVFKVTNSEFWDFPRLRDSGIGRGTLPVEASGRWLRWHLHDDSSWTPKGGERTAAKWPGEDRDTLRKLDPTADIRYDKVVNSVTNSSINRWVASWKIHTTLLAFSLGRKLEVERKEGSSGKNSEEVFNG